ncbi:polysaccharide deacetylase family protein [Mycolicibacterium fluoranthenivorans]|uniref:Peptidoglycan/xylan/chitin deacetylase, PgdA/CDA1 family n=1 Tax=Mycolicibacterium fluoranthenivorans TaxID=258505 RepID=A0A1G4VI37_9MYCO|nr:polysaccharide deacetylase family protein [Mycolicibacterium fluoranthenivorans]SCX07152.1 Peptidoglycan/xylan/chitin deacetylase, PgdA/CDA1 family [Mycolicibacterium fluoranthenivorans]
MAKTRDIAAGLLCACGVPVYARWRSSRRLAILMFHGVENEPLSPPCDWVIDTSGLRRRLQYVRRHFTILPLEEALERLRDGTLPRRVAVVTFDDGTRNLLTNAAPVLRELEIPAAVFVATGPMGSRDLLWPDQLWQAFAQTTRSEIDLTGLGLGICSLHSPSDRSGCRERTTQFLKGLPDEDRVAAVTSVVAGLGQDIDGDGGPFQMLSWDDARSLASDGLVTVYPHSVTHPILSRCDDEKVASEVSESCRAVEINFGHAPKVFAYPNGRPEDFDDRTRSALRRNGIRWALSTINGFADRDSDPLALPRVGFAAHQSFSVFKLKVSGFAPPSRRRHSRSAAEPAHRKVVDDVSV